MLLQVALNLMRIAQLAITQVTYRSPESRPKPDAMRKGFLLGSNAASSADTGARASSGAGLSAADEGRSTGAAGTGKS